MPIYLMVCHKCGVQKNELMKYEDMKAGVTCECGEEMKNKICPSRLKGTSSDRHIMAPPVGPNDKRSRAYEKKMDDKASMDAYKPGGTFGTDGAKGFKERQIKIKDSEKGKTNFTKD